MYILFAYYTKFEWKCQDIKQIIHLNQFEKVGIYRRPSIHFYDTSTKKRQRRKPGTAALLYNENPQLNWGFKKLKAMGRKK